MTTSRTERTSLPAGALLPLLILAFAGQANAAVSAAELRASINAEAARNRGAVAEFLDARRAEPARLSAAKSVHGALSPEHVAPLIVTAEDAKQSTAIRVSALQLLGPYYSSRPKLVEDMTTWAKDRQVQLPLRVASLDGLHVMLLTGATMQRDRVVIIGTLREIMRDPILDIRRRALTLLAGEGDPPAQRLLADGLSNPRESALPPAESIELLGLHLRTDFYPSLAALLRNPPDPVSRVQAIRFLGGFPPVHDTLVAIVRNPRESLAARQAAAGTLLANDPDHFSAVILPVVQDEHAPEVLRVLGIQSEMLRRASTSYRHSVKARDDFDQTVARLETGSTSTAVRSAAARYQMDLRRR